MIPLLMAPILFRRLALACVVMLSIVADFLIFFARAADASSMTNTPTKSFQVSGASGWPVNDSSCAVRYPQRLDQFCRALPLSG
jgi:hypothetical protein